MFIEIHLTQHGSEELESRSVIGAGKSLVIGRKNLREFQGGGGGGRQKGEYGINTMCGWHDERGDVAKGRAISMTTERTWAQLTG